MSLPASIPNAKQALKIPDMMATVKPRPILNSEFEKRTSIKNTPFNYQLGIGLRQDKVDDIELSHTANRVTTLENIMLGDVNETNLSGYANTEFKFDKLIVNAGLRYDYFKFDYYERTIRF